MIIIGIDPGSNGGIAILNGANMMVKKMPQTPKDLLDLLKKFSKQNLRVVMEKVGGMPKMGGSAMFNFGKGYGYLEMALLALEISVITVRPQEWQKTFELGTKGTQTTTQWKNKLKAKAQQLYPKIAVTLWSADAILLAEYAKRVHK